MPRWKYREAFNADYLALHKGRGLSHDEIAESLGRSTHTISSYRRKGDHCVIPPEEVIRRFAAMVGMSPFRYMDDPRVADGLGLEKYSDLPQWMKDILQRNTRAMEGSTLSPNQWEMLQDSMITQARTLESAMNSRKKG